MGWIALLLIASSLSSCTDSPTPEPPTATQARPTKTPKPTKPTATPKPDAPNPTNSPNAAKADWTILVYLDGDNDLEQESIDDYAEMASVGSSASLNIIVQFDRISSSEDWDATSSGDWSAVKRFRVERGKKPTKSNQLADLGELNMGDPRTLTDFVTWGIKTYPAKRYGLIFWDHGASWPGVANDDSSDSDMLTLPELATSLAAVRQQTNVQKLDLIGFDACLMGQIDVLQAVAPYGKVAIGSADLEPGEGWAWNAWLSDLAKSPPQEAAAIAPSIIKSFTAFYKKEGDSSVTLSAFDLTKIDQMTKQLDILSKIMIEKMPQSYKAIAKARSYATEYASGDADISAIDLGQFVDSLIAATNNKPLADAARELSQTIKSARIVQGYGADHPKSSGITIYFPMKKKNYDASYVDSSPLTKTTRWDEFLVSFYAGRNGTARSASTKPTLDRTTAAPDAGVSLNATISGADTAYVSYFVGAAIPSTPGSVQILSMDYIYPPGVTNNSDTPTWNDGDPVQLTWKASSWYISNGSDVVLVPFIPVWYGSSTYSVDGTYTRKSGTNIPVSIEFSVLQGRGTLQHVWAFDKSGSDHPRPRELKPKAGDTFTPDLLFYALQSDNADQQTTPGTPLTFGTDPLIAFEGNAPNGNYVIGLLVENTSGDISDQYAKTTVNQPNGNGLPTIPDPIAAPAPSTPGTNAGTLSYHDDQLGFAISYPQDWEPRSPGTDKVVFANPEDVLDASLSVDAYALDGKPASANRAMLADVVNEASSQPDFTLTKKATAIRLADHSALQIEYTYLNRDGTLMHVVGIAVSDTPADVTYLITFEAPQASFADRALTLEQMLADFVID